MATPTATATTTSNMAAHTINLVGAKDLCSVCDDKGVCAGGDPDSL